MHAGDWLNPENDVAAWRAIHVVSSFNCLVLKASFFANAAVFIAAGNFYSTSVLSTHAHCLKTPFPLGRQLLS